jgi:hypothetical protein
VTRILADFGIRVDKPIKIFEDNQSVIHLSENPITARRSKHIDVRFKFIKELVLCGEIKLVYKPTEFQLADILTKGLTKDKFVKFWSMLNIL